MKKKFAMIGAGVLAGSLLLMSSVYAGIGNTPGYDTYKSAIKHTSVLDNATTQANLSIVDNGKVVFQVNSTLKSGKDDETGSAAITLKSGGTEQAIQVYSKDGKDIIKTSNSDVYRVLERGDHYSHKNRKNHDRWQDSPYANEMEKVIDTLVGNLKNKVTLNEAGATKKVSLQLEDSQIPAIVNTIGSIMIRECGRRHDEGQQWTQYEDTFGVNLKQLENSVPELTDDIKIEKVKMDADVNADNFITKHVVEVTISGKDSKGVAHQVAVKFDLSLSEFNKSVPDTIDLKGKKVENVTLPHDQMFNHRK